MAHGTARPPAARRASRAPARREGERRPGSEPIFAGSWPSGNRDDQRVRRRRPRRAHDRGAAAPLPDGEPAGLGTAVRDARHGGRVIGLDARDSRADAAVEGVASAAAGPAPSRRGPRRPRRRRATRRARPGRRTRTAASAGGSRSGRRGRRPASSRRAATRGADSARVRCRRRWPPFPRSHSTAQSRRSRREGVAGGRRGERSRRGQDEEQRAGEPAPDERKLHDGLLPRRS